MSLCPESTQSLGRSPASWVLTDAPVDLIDTKVRKPLEHPPPLSFQSVVLYSCRVFSVNYPSGLQWSEASRITGPVSDGLAI